MSDDSPQGNLSSTAPAGPAQAAMMAAKPISLNNIFLTAAPTVQGRHCGFNIVLQIDPTLALKTWDGTRLFLSSISHKNLASALSIKAVPPSWTSSAPNIRAVIAYSQQSYGVERHLILEQVE